MLGASDALDALVARGACELTQRMSAFTPIHINVRSRMLLVLTDTNEVMST